MNNFKFREFQVYKDACKFRNGIRKVVTKEFPKEEGFDLTFQIFKALNSIILNIAEGAEIKQTKTALNDVVACLDLALNDWLIDEKTHNELLTQAEELANQLNVKR